MRNENKAEKGHGFVVYNTPLGKTKIGIVYARVVFDGDKAYVNQGRQQADILPKANVFQTFSAAEKYLAGKGVKRWVVCEECDEKRPRRRDVPIMFEAEVVFYQYGGRYRNESRWAIKRLSDGKMLNVSDIYGTRVYETKKQAESGFGYLWHQRFKDAKKNMTEYSKLLDALLENPPRKRTKKVRFAAKLTA